MYYHLILFLIIYSSCIIAAGDEVALPLVGTKRKFSNESVSGPMDYNAAKRILTHYRCNISGADYALVQVINGDLCLENEQASIVLENSADVMPIGFKIEENTIVSGCARKWDFEGNEVAWHNEIPDEPSQSQVDDQAESYDIVDSQWNLIKKSFAHMTPKCRATLNAILYLVKDETATLSGANERYNIKLKSTLRDNFKRWCDEGRWDTLYNIFKDSPLESNRAFANTLDYIIKNQDSLKKKFALKTIRR